MFHSTQSDLSLPHSPLFSLFKSSHYHSFVCFFTAGASPGMRTTPSGANSGTPRGLDPATIQKAAAGLSSSVFNNLSAAAAAAGHTTPGVAGYRQVMAQHPVSLDIVKD